MFSNRKNVLWTIISGSLCVFHKSTFSKLNEYERKWSLLFVPIPFEHTVLDECMDILYSLNGSSVCNIHNISDTELNPLKSVCKYHIDFVPDFKDYIYDVSSAKGLIGADYKKIRYYVNHFEKKYSPTIEQYRPELYKECFELFNTWKRRKMEQGGSALYKEHTKEILKELSLFDDMFGVVVRVEGRLVAFSLGGILSESMHTAICIIRKTEPGMEGLSEFIDWKFYMNLPESVTLVNDGDDCMNPSLASYKTKWRPLRVQPLFKAKVSLVK